MDDGYGLERLGRLPERWLRPFAVAVCLLAMVVAADATAADVKPAYSRADRGSNDNVGLGNARSIAVNVDTISTLLVSTNGLINEYFEPRRRAVSNAAGVCGEVTHTSPDNFNGGVFNYQAGFAEDEIAIASYWVNPDDYPISIESMECIFAQNAKVETTTEWFLVIWDGPPYPENVYAIFTSDGTILPHLNMPAGPRATNIWVTVDPDDPSPIILENAGQTNMFSIGFGVEKHNDAPADPCDPLDPSRNAFPATDTDGIATLTENWLSALLCGFLCDGVHAFGDLFEPFCRPTGDWLIRASYSCAVSGACCNVDAVCGEPFDLPACEGQGGTFMGGGTTCDAIVCDDPTGACCFLGQCLPDTTQALCEELSTGVYVGNGTPCEASTCQLGACCMADGSCDDLIELECDAADGVYEGGGTDCTTFDCPQPIGSCCIENTCFPNQPRDGCLAIGTWNGTGSDCSPDPCADPTCPDATILGAIPQTETIDARQPHPPNDANLRQGLGSSAEPIVITLGASGAEDCFTLCESLVDPSLGDNGVVSATDVGSGKYEIVLHHPITPGAVTTIKYLGDGSEVVYTSHPANTNGDTLANGSDVSFILQALEGTANPVPELFSVDLDHSGRLTPADLLREIDLLNGADQLEPWNGIQLPTGGGCP